MVRKRSRTSSGWLFAALVALAAIAPGSAAAAPDGRGGLSAAPPDTVQPPAETTLAQAFPVRGRFSYWDGMGAGRGHQGVDLGARCGTPLVAALPGRVRMVKYHGRAGHYVVVDVKGSPLDLVYMHLRQRASVRPGQGLRAGTLLGRVGDTGNASGCHLHFEIWDGGYYRGGSPIDPMPFLSAWDRERKRLARLRRGA